MLIEGIQARKEEETEKTGGVSGAELILQGIATSIDALSVGFTIAAYSWARAGAASLIIAAVTFLICLLGVSLGKKFGLYLAGRAQILGGVILIIIGLEIFLTR